MKIYETNKVLIAQIPNRDIPDDVLERISGYESFDDAEESGEKIYYVTRIQQILDNPEDDTNETTKGRIEDLYEQIKDCVYFKVATTY